MAKKEYPDAPRVAVGAVVIHQQQVLLVLRGQPPSQDMWAIPGGSVELGETLQQAAEREIREETGLLVRAGEPVYIFDTVQRGDDGRVRFHYVIVDVLAEPIDPAQPLQSADDARDARWFSLAEVNSSTWNVAPPTRKLLNKLMKEDR
jgi:ADP-ribose pyrophosphatase